MSQGKISKDKQYKTRDGREVRIYATDGAGEYPVHGALKSSNGWVSATWGSHGHVVKPCRESPEDLIEFKPRMKFERWIFVDDSGLTKTFSEPPTVAGPGCFAVKHIVFEVEKGEGL
jgi:hypothetical protein